MHFSMPLLEESKVSLIPKTWVSVIYWHTRQTSSIHIHKEFWQHNNGINNFSDWLKQFVLAVNYCGKKEQRTVITTLQSRLWHFKYLSIKNLFTGDWFYDNYQCDCWLFIMFWDHYFFLIWIHKLLFLILSLFGHLISSPMPSEGFL